ncbi:MAG: T9SS type A sorting domain-containing protein [Crocinitomicaceae bacterium]|nr:T9SS type A sorting domain-containing protein [Crocinitomicaceae bacterium]MCF8411649.1 T9SS type A sorting domain-containing protein [Crocinitomicaceae bacterium]MCF8445343.1 T9SS type A sorting domain-containing protein [Crocinitomicaceae bacterium]
MKRIYLLFLCSIIGGNLTAQLPSQSIQTRNKYASFEAPIKPVQLTQQKGVVIWQNDFSVGSDWVYDNTSSPYLDWTITTNADTIPVTTLSPAVFTSVNNGFAFINSDAQGQSGTQNANMTYTGSIDCSAYSNVSIVFEQSYRTYLDTRIIRVSNDGGTIWTDFIVTDGTEPTAQNSPNPDVYSINISSVAGGQANVKVQINYQGNWGWYWAIDDMKIIETDQYDIKLQTTSFGTDGAFGARLPYFQIPTAQIAPINFGGVIKNIGVQDINDAGFTAVVTGASGFYSGVGGPLVIPAATQDTIYCSTTFTPAATSSIYSVQVAATTVNSEPDVANNVLPNFQINVNPFIYARDNGQILGGISNSGEGYEVGHIFDIFSSATLYGIDAVINASSEPGAEIFVKLYSIDPATGDFIFVDESAPYVITQADLGQPVILPLATPITLNANDSYLAVVGSYGDGGATNDLVSASSGASEPQTSFYFDYTDNTWYYTTSNVMVRMNFDPSLSVNTLAKENGLLVYPNPAQEVITIQLKEEIDATFTLMDSKGVEVRSNDLTGLFTTINTSGLSNGIYFLSINDGNSTSTTKIILNN